VSLVLFAVAVLLQLAAAPIWAWSVSYAGCYLAGGWEPGLAGLRALREHTLDVDLLMIVAALGAAAIGQVFDGALLVVIFATSGALEAWATARTEDSVRGLLDLSPDEASLVGADGERRVRAADLEVGDVIAVRPGESIGADGVVVDGAGEVDQASITGEPLPVTKTGGSEVFAGTINRTGALRVRVTRSAEDWVVARIAALVEQAARTKARTQLFIEKVEQRYSVGVVVATLALFAVPLALGEDLGTALLRAMTFMIVASPCAVVLATMPPLLAAIANAGRRGVLVKTAPVMEQLAGVDAVAFDKTGTLTRGTPEVTAVHSVGGEDVWDESAVLAVAAAAEGPSEHPLGRAVVRAAQRRGLVRPSASEFTSAPGRGVRARVDGRLVGVASPSAEALDRAPSGTAELIRRREDDGHTVVVVTVDERPVGVLALSDELRPDAARAVAALTARTGGSPVLLTGDNPGSAAAVAAQVGITEVHAELLPADKVEALDRLRGPGHRILAVGDGVNDAPALAAADVGVAMGRGGADLTLQAAGVVIVRDELDALPVTLALARRVRRTVVANLVIAATIIVGLVTWDLVGHLPLPLGVAGHEGSTVLVGLNGLRLLRSAAWGPTIR
jgi:heavy metal translocating P-type ATPase